MKNEDKGVSRIAAPGDGYRWQQTGYIGDDVFTVYLLGVRFDSNHRLLPSTTIKSIMTGGVSTVDSRSSQSDVTTSCYAHHHLCRRSQLSAALTLILNYLTKQMHFNQSIRFGYLTPHYPKQRRVLVFVCAVQDEEWRILSRMSHQSRRHEFHSVFQNFSERVKMFIPLIRFVGVTKKKEYL